MQLLNRTLYQTYMNGMLVFDPPEKGMLKNVTKNCSKAEKYLAQ